MRLFFDLDINRFVAAPGSQVSSLDFDFKRGDDADTIDLSFVKGGIVIELASGATGKFGLKEDGQFGEGFVVSAASWTKTGTGEDTIYSFSPNFNTTQLNRLLIDGEISQTVADEAARFALTGLAVGTIVEQEDDASYWIVIDADNLGNSAGWDDAPTKDEVTLYGEFQWIIAGKRRSTPTFESVVANDVIKDDEGLPTDADPGYYDRDEVDALLALRTPSRAAAITFATADAVDLPPVAGYFATQPVIIEAGSGAYSASLNLTTDGAVDEGKLLRLVISLPAAADRVITITDNNSSETIASFTSIATAYRAWVDVMHDGTRWQWAGSGSETV